MTSQDSQFDVVRKGISEPHRANNRYEYDNALRALRRIEEQLETCQKEKHVQNLEWAISLAESDPLYAEVLRPYFQKIMDALASNPATSPDDGWHESAAHTPILQPLGACGLVSADGRYACIKDIGHEGPHGSDPASEPKDAP